MKLAHTMAMALLTLLCVLNVAELDATERWISEDAPNEAQRILARDYVQVTRSHDLEVLRRLYYEPSLLCKNHPENISVDQLLKNRIDIDIPDDYQLSVSKYVVRNEPSELEKIVGEPLVEYVVTPTYELKIRFEVHDKTKEFPFGKKMLAFRMIEKEEGWYFVFECLGPGYSEFVKLRSE